jgi:hypothetical protein
MPQHKLEEVLKKNNIKFEFKSSPNVSEILKAGVDVLKNPTELNKIKSTFLDELKKIKDDRINEILKPKSTELSPFASNNMRQYGGREWKDLFDDAMQTPAAIVIMPICCVLSIPICIVSTGIDIGCFIANCVNGDCNQDSGGKRARSKKRKATKRTNRRRNRGRTHRK